MALSDEEAMRIVARLVVLEHVVASTVRDLALSAGKSADEVAALAEEAKRFFEQKSSPEQEVYLNAAVDRLYQQIVADMRSRESH